MNARLTMDIVELATRVTVRTGLHAWRATGITVTERGESFTRTESVARWSREGRAAYGAERQALLFIYIYFYSWTGARCFRGRQLLHERGRGVFSLFEFSFFRFHFHSFCGAAAVLCCVISRSYIQVPA